MASSPELPSGEKRASSPATSRGIATHAQMGGETLAHAQREHAPVSAGNLVRERQYDFTVDTGASGDLTKEVTVQVL